MRSGPEARPPDETGAVFFATTHWSAVTAAGETSAPGAQEALERLCRNYWYQHEPAQDAAPEAMFDRRWALTLLEAVLATLKHEYASTGRGAVFEVLQPVLSGDSSAFSYADLGARLGLNVGAVKVAVHRLRRRYGELLRTAVAKTVAAPQDVDEEMRHLFAALG